MASTLRRERPSLALWLRQEKRRENGARAEGQPRPAGDWRWASRSKWKRPTAAALRLQREREYLDWFAVPPHCHVTHLVQDWDAFMAERCQTTEQERLQQRAHRRKEAHHARGLLHKPAGQGPQHGWVPLGCGQL